MHNRWRGVLGRVLPGWRQDEFQYTGFLPLVFMMATRLIMRGLFAMVLLPWDYKLSWGLAADVRVEAQKAN